jgi:hypothetical protein
MAKGGNKDYQNATCKRESGKDNAGQGGSSHVSSLYQGLDRSLPRAPSDMLSAASVNATSTRGSAAAPTPKTLGPRTA